MNERTAEEIEEAAWMQRGWVTVWTSTLAHPSGRGRRYWGRYGNDGILRVHPGVSRPPDEVDEPHFYVNGTRVYRDFGHLMAHPPSQSTF